MTSSRSIPARLLIVDDDPAIRKIIRDRFCALGHEVSVAENGKLALERIEAEVPHVVLLDLRMPELDGFGVLDALQKKGADCPDVVVITAHGSIDSAVRAIKMGAVDFIPKPFDNTHLEYVVERALKAQRLRSRVNNLQSQLRSRHALVGAKSQKMREAVQVVERAAPSNATVLLLGESGSGKEVLARHTHEKSPRKDAAFVALNCATLSAELLSSELFGHEKGAFTGAVKTKIGRIEAAAGGTLFLDEIGELPNELQAKLLRVLQEREFERLGSTRTIQSNVRIIAATHRNLNQAIDQGSFRQDLYYRLNVVNVTVPPLRERCDDIEELATYFLKRHCMQAGRAGLHLDPQVMKNLVSYSWPGNVRELSNALERCVVLAASDTIGLDDFPEEIRECRSLPPSDCTVLSPSQRLGATGVGSGEGFHELVAEAKRSIIVEALELTEGHQTRAAKELSLTQPYLARLMKNLGLKSNRN